MRTLVIIPANIRDTINNLIAANEAFPVARAQEFTVPLYAIDDEVQSTPTHYWLSHIFTAEQRAAISQLNAAFPTAKVFDYTDPAFPHQQLLVEGLATTKSSMV